MSIKDSDSDDRDFFGKSKRDREDDADFDGEKEKNNNDDDFFRDDDFEFEGYKGSEPEEAGFRSKRSKEKQRRRKMITSTIAVMLILVVVAVGIVFGYRWIKNRFFAKTEVTEEERISVPGSLELGQDLDIVFAFADENLLEPDVNSIIFSSYYSAENKMISLCIPAKTLMDIPGIGAELVGNSVKMGGMDLLKLTLEKGLGMNLDIDYYILIDVLNAVNALGGLELSMDEETTIKNYNDSTTFKLEKGSNLIDGSEAINFLKYFSGIETEVPINNIEKQKLLLSTLISKIVGQNDEEFTSNLNNVKDFISTDLSMEEEMKLFSTLANLGGDKDTTYVLEVSSTELEGEGIVFLPELGNLAEIFSVEEEPVTEDATEIEETVNVTILNGVGTPLIAKQVQELLESHKFESGKKKFNIIEIGNADNFNYSQTEIRTYTADKAYVVNAASEIKEILGAGNVSNLEEDMGTTDIVIILGSDFTPGTTDTDAADVGELEGVAKLIILNGEGTAKLASTVKDILENHFNAEKDILEVIETKDADNYDYTQTQITIYTSGEGIESLAQQIQERLGVGVVTKSDTNPENIDIGIILGSDYTDNQ